MTSPDAWPTPTATDRAGRTTNVIPLFPDQPTIAALRGGRPLRLHFDAWLHAGGRELGYQGAASVEVQDAPGVLEALIAALDEEVAARGWGREDIETASVVEGRELRFYWWTTDAASAAKVASGAGRAGEEARLMASAHDVAAYILRARGPMSTMKLQKLVYYSQAWHLVWEQRPLFAEKIEAWANGPVVYELFDAHRGRYTIGPEWAEGDPGCLSSEERSSIDAVLESYGDLSGRQLSHLTHSEGPWREARRGLGPTDRSSSEITIAAMADFYEALDADEEAKPVDELAWPGWDRDAND